MNATLYSKDTGFRLLSLGGEFVLTCPIADPSLFQYYLDAILDALKEISALKSVREADSETMASGCYPAALVIPLDDSESDEFPASNLRTHKVCTFKIVIRTRSRGRGMRACLSARKDAMDSLRNHSFSTVEGHFMTAINPEEPQTRKAGLMFVNEGSFLLDCHNLVLRNS